MYLRFICKLGYVQARGGEIMSPFLAEFLQEAPDVSLPKPETESPQATARMIPTADVVVVVEVKSNSHSCSSR